MSPSDIDRALGHLGTNFFKITKDHIKSAKDMLVKAYEFEALEEQL